MTSRYLKHRNQERCHHVVSFPDSLDHMVKVSNSEEERAYDDGPEMRIITWNAYLIWHRISNNPDKSFNWPNKTGTIQALKVNSSLNGATTWFLHQIQSWNWIWHTFSTLWNNLIWPVKSASRTLGHRIPWIFPKSEKIVSSRNIVANSRPKVTLP